MEFPPRLAGFASGQRARRSRLSLLALAFLLIPLTSLSAQETSSSVEQLLELRQALKASLEQAIATGKPAASIAAAEQLAKHERALVERMKAGGQIPSSAQSPLVAFDNVLTWLSQTLAAQRQWKQAISTQQELFDLRTTVLGDEDPRSVDARLRLADLQLFQNWDARQLTQLKTTEQLHQQALQAYHKKEFDKALQLERQVESIRTELLGTQHHLTVTATDNLGLLAFQLGQLETAITAYRRAELARRSLLGIQHQAWQQTADNLIDLLRRQIASAMQREDYLAAAELAAERLTLALERHGAQDWHVTNAVQAVADTHLWSTLSTEDRKNLARATTLNRQAVEFQQAGQLTEAEQRVLQALEIREALLGPDHPLTLLLLSNLAYVHHAQNAPLAAVREMRKVLSRQQRSQTGKHPRYRSNLKRMDGYLNAAAGQAKQTGDFRSAIGFSVDQQQLRKLLYGETDYRVVDVQQHLAYLQRFAEVSHAERQQLTTAEKQSERIEQLRLEGKADEAIRLSKEIVETFQTILGDQTPRYATSLIELARLHQEMGSYRQAESLYRKAQAIHESVLGKAHPVYATVLSDLMELSMLKGEYLRAESLGIKAKAIREQVLGKEHRQYALSLSNLAHLYQKMGDYSRAEAYAEQAKAIREKILGREHLDYAVSLNNLGLLYHEMGSYDRAKPCYEEALAIRKKRLGQQHPDYANCLNNLAGLHEAMNDYPRAEPLYLEAKAIYAQVLGKQHPSYAGTLHNLASLYQAMGNFSQAETFLLESKAIREQVQGEEHPDYANCLGNLAGLYHALGDYEKALPLMVESKTISAKILGKEHPAYAISLGNLASMYLATGNVLKAETLCAQTVEICANSLGRQHPVYAESLTNLAFLYGVQRKIDRAVPLFREALQVTRASLETAAVVQSERQQLAMAEGLRGQLDGLLSVAVLAGDYQEPAFREVLAWKGATLVRQRQLRKVIENDQAAPLFRQLQQTTTRLATLSRTFPDTDKQAEWRGQIIELTAAKERLETKLSRQSAEFRAAKKQVTLEDLLTTLPADAVLIDFLEYTKFVPRNKELQQPLPVRSLLTFVVRPSAPIALLDLGPVAPISEAIDTWRRTYGTSQAGAIAAQTLRKQLWQPLEKHMEGADLVLVSPDGVLGRLPLGALPGRKSGTYLLEDYRLVMLPVPQLLPALVTELGRKELSGGLLLMGDVNYDATAESSPGQPQRQGWKRSSTASVRSAEQYFSPLDATAGEIATIKDLFIELFQPGPNEIKTLRKAAATEQEFRQSAARYYNLHLATHGFFAPPEKKSALAGSTGDQQQRKFTTASKQLIRGFHPGLLSGLAFSGANRKPAPDQDDGILTADEIATLSLDGVDLVVLSACETGLGEIAGGEGLLGVQRAFQVAGARTTVASLWQVGDVATRRLMERFYRNYWEKEMSKVDALREAQLYLLNHPEAVRGDRRLRKQEKPTEPSRLSPELWAAFSISGDWR